MADRPIIFSAGMVKALLSGRKTQLRAVFKLPEKQFEHPQMGGWEPTTNGGGAAFRIDRDGSRIPVPETVGIWHQTSGKAFDAPNQAGDRLYVRETWAALGAGGRPPFVYRADTDGERVRVDAPWRSSAVMPRAASRLTLLVTDVRVEQLQDISEADAVAEGIKPFGASGSYTSPKHRDGKWRPGDNAYEMFADLWRDIHGPGAWEANPWVAAVSFEVRRANIDAPSLALPASAIEGGTEP